MTAPEHRACADSTREQRFYLGPIEPEVFSSSRTGVGGWVNIPLAGRIPRQDIWWKLVKHDIGESPLANVDDMLASHAQRKLCQMSYLIELPTELAWEIMRMLEVVDLLNLSFTCQTLFCNVCDFISNDVWQESGIWSGLPLATTGSFTEQHCRLSHADELIVSMDPLWMSRIVLHIERHGEANWENYQLCSGKWYLLWPADASFSEPTLDCPFDETIAFNERATLDTCHTWSSELLEIEKIPVKQMKMSVSSTQMGNKASSRQKRASQRNSAVNPGFDLMSRWLLPIAKPSICICKSHDTDKRPIYCLRNHTTYDLVRICSPSSLQDSANSPPSSTSHLLPVAYSLDEILTIQTRHSGVEWQALGSLGGPLHQENESWISGPWQGHTFDIVSALRHAREYPNLRNLRSGRQVTLSSTRMLPKSSNIQWQDVTADIAHRMTWERDLFDGLEKLWIDQDPRSRKRKATTAAEAEKCKHSQATSMSRICASKWTAYMHDCYPGAAGRRHVVPAGGGLGNTPPAPDPLLRRRAKARTEGEMKSGCRKSMDLQAAAVVRWRKKLNEILGELESRNVDSKARSRSSVNS